jgi:hypothetical protein
MPVINNLTAAGAFVGLVLGVVGIWKSTRIMSWTGVGRLQRHVHGESHLPGYPVAGPESHVHRLGGGPRMPL